MHQEKEKANQLLSCKLLPSKPANVSVEPSKFDPFKLIFLQSQAEQSLQTSKQVIIRMRIVITDVDDKLIYHFS